MVLGVNQGVPYLKRFVTLKGVVCEIVSHYILMLALLITHSALFMLQTAKYPLRSKNPKAKRSVEIRMGTIFPFAFFAKSA